MEYKDAIQTKDLQLHIDQLKEEMRRKQYSDFEIREMDYVWQNLLSYAKQNPVERFDEAYRQKFLNDIYAKEMESRDSMYRITRAMNMLSDFIYFRVIFRQYCTPKTDFSEEYHDAFHSFIESEKRRNLSKIAIRTIFVRLMRFHDYLIDIGVYNLNELSVEHINQYILSLARYSTTYTSDALRTLRRFFTYAHENNYCKESFAHCIPRVKNLRQQKLPTIFSSEEIEKILGTIDRHNPIGKRNYAIIMLAVRTGLRSGDIQNLTFSNINWDEKSLNLIREEPVLIEETAEEGVLSFETTDLDGNPVSSEELFGNNKITVVNLWVSWCGSCIMEMPELNAFNQRIQEKDCEVVGILIDGNQKEALAEGIDLVEETGAEYLMLKPFAGVDWALPVQAFPTTYFVDSEGRLLGRPIVGASVPLYEERLEELLEEME